MMIPRGFRIRQEEGKQEGGGVEREREGKDEEVTEMTNWGKARARKLMQVYDQPRNGAVRSQIVPRL